MNTETRPITQKISEKQMAELIKAFLEIWQNLTTEDLEKIALLIHKPQFYHAESLADALGISRTQLYRLRRQGIIPEPRKIPGLKQKLYTPQQLQEIKKQLPAI